MPILSAQRKKTKAITLIELIMSMSMLGLLSIGIWSINSFIHLHLFNTSNRAKLQAEVSYIVEHMAKEITGLDNDGGAIGDIDNPAIDIRTIGNRQLVKIFADKNANSMRDGLDYWVAYDFFSGGTNAYQFRYFARCNGPSCNLGGTIGPEVLSGRIRTFSVGNYLDSNNYLPVGITACWDVGSIATCGAPDNPMVEFRVRLKMPAVSVR